MFLHSSMTDNELIRSTMLVESPYLKLLAYRLELRMNQLNNIQKLCESVNNSSKWDCLQQDGFEDIGQLFCQIETLTTTDNPY